MATTIHWSGTLHTVGELPSVGSRVPGFTLTGNDLADFTADVARGRRVVFNIFPSIDTGICATSVRRFNELAGSLENTTVLCVSNDLPYALGRFCGAEGIENAITASGFRSSFGDDFGVTLVDGAIRGLLARAIVVADAEGVVVHTELVPKVSQEPDYDAALAALAG